MIARSLLDLLLTLFLVVTIVFFAVELVPGDPAEAALAQSTVSQEALQQRREALGLDRPVLVRYVDYLTGLLRGDAGRSWVTGQPAMVLVASQLGPTLNLVAAGMAAAVAGGLLLGLLSALVGPVARTLSGVALALPVMATGLILIWLFSVQAALFPASGQGSLSRLVLPAVTVAIPAAGAIARAADAGLTDARDAPFWHAVRSRGL
ncbi:MAG: ABC transporter permease, partial [Chloroflexi bacterium]|nr:ABC transporter permease [Chloroflexota bacterium]